MSIYNYLNAGFFGTVGVICALALLGVVGIMGFLAIILLFIALAILTQFIVVGCFLMKGLKVIQPHLNAEKKRMAKR